MRRALLISGFFDEAEIADLMLLVRSIERRHPEQLYRIDMIGENYHHATTEESARFLERVFPTLEGKPVDIQVIRRDELGEPPEPWIDPND